MLKNVMSFVGPYLHSQIVAAEQDSIACMLSVAIHWKYWKVWDVSMHGLETQEHMKLFNTHALETL